MSFSRLDATDFVISADSVTAPAWSTNSPVLTQFFTLASDATGSYYLDVYQTASNLSNAAIQFSIAYGHIYGSGSAPLNPLIPQNTPSRITFGQYRNLMYGDAESPVDFSYNGTGVTSSLSLVAIAIDRNRYKESLMPGTFNLVLGAGSSLLSLTDNSNDVSTVTYIDGGRVYNLISGSNGSAASSPTLTGASKGYTVSGSYGFYLPDMGAIILNPAALALPVGSSGGGLNVQMTGSTSPALGGFNQSKVLELFVSGARAFALTGSGFQLNSQETISSNYVFVRIKNGEYNYTSNPSFISGSGNLVYSNFINSPQTFPTTVGMYNDNNELLAVAKMSKPLTKDFTKEALIRVKLDW
jgi:hypothetical protein